jgi:hypothetical protein
MALPRRRNSLPHETTVGRRAYVLFIILKMEVTGERMGSNVSISVGGSAGLPSARPEVRSRPRGAFDVALVFWMVLPSRCEPQPGGGVHVQIRPGVRPKIFAIQLQNRPERFLCHRNRAVGGGSGGVFSG